MRYHYFALIILLAGCSRAGKCPDNCPPKDMIFVFTKAPANEAQTVTMYRLGAHGTNTVTDSVTFTGQADSLGRIHTPAWKMKRSEALRVVMQPADKTYSIYGSSYGDQRSALSPDCRPGCNESPTTFVMNGNLLVTRTDTLIINH